MSERIKGIRSTVSTDQQFESPLSELKHLVTDLESLGVSFKTEIMKRQEAETKVEELKHKVCPTSVSSNVNMIASRA